MTLLKLNLTLLFSISLIRESDSKIICNGNSFEFKVANFQHAHGVLNISGCLP
jgi:hypothetical protein